MVLQLSDLVNHYPIRCSIAEYLTTRELRAIACTSKDNYDHIVGSRPEVFASLKKYTICEGKFAGAHRVPLKEGVGELKIRIRKPCLGRARTFCEGCGAAVCTSCCCNTSGYGILRCGRFSWVLPSEDLRITNQCGEYFYSLRGNRNHSSEDQAKDHICSRCFVKRVRLQFRSIVKEDLGFRFT